MASRRIAFAVSILVSGHGESAGSTQSPSLRRLLAGVVARLGSVPAAKKQIDNRYIREKEAAAFLGISVYTLQSWRSKGETSSPPFTKVGGMVMYSMKDLEEYMEQRTVGRR